MKINTLLKITIGILCILVSICVWSLFSLISDMEVENKTLKLDKEMEVLATKLQGASDYLTNEVRAYTQFGDQKHYDNYWEEVNETKTRDQVVEQLQKLQVPNELLSLVEQAQNNSNNLIRLEEQAMEAVANNNLTLARQLVYGKDYAEGKEIIAEPLNRFKTELQQWTNGKIISAEEDVQTKLTILISSFITVVIALAIAFTILTRKLKPLGKLNTMANQFASGNLKYEVMNIQSKDEVATLSQSFQTMASQLREILLTVHKTSENLAASSEQLLAGTEQTNSITQQVNRAIDTVAVDTSQQSAYIEKSANVLHEVLEGINVIANSVDTVSKSSEDTTSKSHIGAKQIQEAIIQMKSIEQIVHKTATSVQMLSERSKEIEEIMSTIKAISEQTNLLSLNASIEAARAGEHGKGFAVVANEVKKLAEQTNVSAQHITNIIESIQQDTNAAVSQMEGVTKQVVNGVSLIEETGNSFNDILHSSNNALNKIKEMVAISKTIAGNTAQVADAFSAVNNFAKNTTTQTHTVSALAEEQLATMEEIAASTEGLTKLAYELNSELTKFKL